MGLETLSHAASSPSITSSRCRHRKTPIAKDPTTYLYEAPWAACTITSPNYSLYQEGYQSPKVGGLRLTRSWSAANPQDFHAPESRDHAPKPEAPYAACTSFGSINSEYRATYLPSVRDGSGLRSSKSSRSSRRPQQCRSVQQSISSMAGGAPHTDLMSV